MNDPAGQKKARPRRTVRKSIFQAKEAHGVDGRAGKPYEAVIHKDEERAADPPAGAK
jgi:hypothetical protein